MPLLHLLWSHRAFVVMAVLQKGALSSTHRYQSPVGQVCVAEVP